MSTSTSVELPLDHIGLLCSDLGAAITKFRHIGFNVQGPERLIFGKKQHFTQSSAHILFPDTYIELTSIIGDAREHPVAPWIARGEGVRLLILRAEDCVTAHDAAEESGLGPGNVQKASRRVPYSDCGEARFSWFSLAPDAFPEGLVGFVQHQTLRTVFDRSVMDHSNGARGISRIWQTGKDPTRAASRFGRLSASGCRMEFLDRARAQQKFPDLTLEGMPSLIAFEVQVKSLAAQQALLDDSGVEYQVSDGNLITALFPAAALVFTEGGE